MLILQRWSLQWEEEWSCYRGSHFNGGRMVMLQRWSNGGRMVMLERWCLMEGA